MATDMTKGNINKHLIGFAVPLILGNLFQLTYNAADSIIVGRFVGTDALAAVGTANPIMNIVMFLIIGICMGASVLMSEYFGAGDLKKFKREVSTTILAFFYLLPSWTNGIQGYFRGMGDLKVTLMSTFLQIVGRVLFAYILSPRMGIVGIALSCFAGWIIMLAYEVPTCIKHRRLH